MLTNSKSTANSSELLRKMAQFQGVGWYWMEARKKPKLAICCRHFPRELRLLSEWRHIPWPTNNTLRMNMRKVRFSCRRIHLVTWQKLASKRKSRWRMNQLKWLISTSISASTDLPRRRICLGIIQNAKEQRQSSSDARKKRVATVKWSSKCKSNIARNHSQASSSAIRRSRIRKRIRQALTSNLVKNRRKWAWTIGRPLSQVARKIQI